MWDFLRALLDDDRGSGFVGSALDAREELGDDGGLADDRLEVHADRDLLLAGVELVAADAVGDCHDLAVCCVQDHPLERHVAVGITSDFREFCGRVGAANTHDLEAVFRATHLL